jgi:hypothetical protein
MDNSKLVNLSALASFSSTISAYLVVEIDAMPIIFYYLSLLAEEATEFHFDSAVGDSKHCILARQGKKKVTTGSNAAEQQDCISGLPQQVYLSLAQMYILVCICLFHTGFNLCQACPIISKISCHFTMPIWKKPSCFYASLWPFCSVS